MKHLFLFLSLTLLNSFNSFGQVLPELDQFESAYFYHVVRKSPIIENEIGKYIVYTGPEIRFMNKELNHDSIEQLIISDIRLLKINYLELHKCSRGILLEVANKMALQHLNKFIDAKGKTEKEFEAYSYEQNLFESIFIVNLPSSALKLQDGEMKPNQKLYAVINPSLNFQDKAAMLASFPFLSAEEQLQTMKAIEIVISDFVGNFTSQFYVSILGGSLENENLNYLLAAGDGSDTSGEIKDREKDENNRWTKGLPKAVGFFPYQSSLIPEKQRKKTSLQANFFPVIDLNTPGESLQNVLHFDVWAYNPKAQTTLVIERNGLSYHLFGNSENRFLSPDSSFTENGKTFQRTITDLEQVKIKLLFDKIYGKKGFDEQIAEAKKRKDEVELLINKGDHSYSDMTQQPIRTSEKAPKSVKKKKRKANLGTSASKSSNTTPETITYSQKQQRGNKQTDIVSLNAEYQYYRKLIADLEKQKQEAIDLMARYQLRLDIYKTEIGRNWAKYKIIDGIYHFQDSSSFNMATQDFTFKSDTLKTPYEVRLLAIPTESLSNEAEEVILHMSCSALERKYDARFQGVFSSTNQVLEIEPLRFIDAKTDSISIHSFIQKASEKKMKITTSGIAHGLSKWNGYRAVRCDFSEIDLNNSPSENDQLRSLYFYISMQGSIDIELNSTTFATDEIDIPTELTEFFTKNNLNENDYFTLYQLKQGLQILQRDLNEMILQNCDPITAKKVNSKINKAFKSAKVTCGKAEIKLSDIE